jgi:hypothetical protein
MIWRRIWPNLDQSSFHREMESIESGGYPSPYVSAPLPFRGWGAALENPFVPNDC